MNRKFQLSNLKSQISDFKFVFIPISILLLIAAAKPDLLSLARAGETLTDKQAQKIETDLEKSGDSAELRAQLLGYDSARKANLRPSRLLAILWMIDHRTEDAIAGSVYCQIDQTDDPEGYAKAKAAWDAQVGAHPKDAPVAANAAAFFAAGDFSAADALLQQAITLEPKNADWPERAAQLYERRFTQHPDDTARLAPAALQLRQSAYNLTLDPKRRFAVLVRMPGDAVGAEDLIAAKRLATQLLATAPKFKTDPAYGDAIHWGNIALGEIALGANRFDDADQYLLAAGQTPGSPTLASVGPDFQLAKQLLAKGERGTVHDYLTACNKFWPAGGERLKTWLTTVDAGGTPEW
jgi:tetratricopeptide (TPR) repeat protein